MGLFDWLLPSVEKKVAKARKLLGEGRFAEARLLLLDLDDSGARAALREAEVGLVRVNLEGAIQWCRAGDEAQVAAHIERAHAFHPGGLEAVFAETEATLVAVRRRRDHSALWESLEESARRRERLGMDPTDPAWVAKNTGAIQLADAEKDPNGVPRLTFYPEPAIYEPRAIAVTSEEEPSQAQVDAALVALRTMYPADLAGALTETHARAVLGTVGGHPERAVRLLLAEREGDAVASFELGRAACALGNYEAADLAFGLFGELAGHRTVGEVHSAEAQAQVVAHLGEKGRALQIIEALRQKAPHQAAFLFAALCVENGKLDAARPVVATLRRSAPKDKRLAPIVAALALREAVAALSAEFSVLRGVVPESEEEEMKQRGALAEALGAAVEKAMKGLPG